MTECFTIAVEHDTVNDAVIIRIVPCRIECDQGDVLVVRLLDDDMLLTNRAKDEVWQTRAEAVMPAARIVRECRNLGKRCRLKRSGT